jgi:AraC-like DNA-binding protein
MNVAGTTSSPGLSAWRKTVADVFDASLDEDDLGHFECSVTTFATPHCVIVCSSVTRSRLVRTLHHISAGQVDHIGIMLLIDGSIVGLAGFAQVSAGAGDIVILDLLQTLDLQVSGDCGSTSSVTLWVPRSRITSAVSNDNLLHGLLVAKATPTGAVIGATIRAVSEVIGDAPHQEANAIANGAVELIARAIGPHPNLASESTLASPLTSLITIRKYIDRNLALATLDAFSLARTFGLSRASLYRLFEPIGGVASYIRKARLIKAYQNLSASELSNQPVAQVAYRLGFANVSSFNRAFRELYGETPGDVRARARLVSPPVLTTVAPNANSLIFMLRAIGTPVRHGGAMRESG